MYMVIWLRESKYYFSCIHFLLKTFTYVTHLGWEQISMLTVKNGKNLIDFKTVGLHARGGGGDTS